MLLFGVLLRKITALSRSAMRHVKNDMAGTRQSHS
jgi:hypothetical protein